MRTVAVVVAPHLATGLGRRIVGEVVAARGGEISDRYGHHGRAAECVLGEGLLLHAIGARLQRGKAVAPITCRGCPFERGRTVSWIQTDLATGQATVTRLAHAFAICVDKDGAADAGARELDQRGGRQRVG